MGDGRPAAMLRRLAAPLRRLGTLPGRRGWAGIGAGLVLGVALELVVSSLWLRPAADDEADLEPGELVVLSGQDVSLGGQRQQLIDQWNATHPDTPARIVELSGVADLQRSQMIAAEQTGGAGYDVLNLDTVWTAEFAAGGYIRPLDTSHLDTSGFLDKPLESCRYEGKLWALPFNTDVGLLYYRKDILGAEGLAPPTTWKQLEDISKDLVPKYQRRKGYESLEAGYVGQLAPYEGLTVNALEAVWDTEGDVVDDDGKVVADVDDGISRLIDDLGGSPPVVLHESLADRELESLRAFMGGKVLFMRNWPYVYRTLAAQASSGGEDGEEAPGVDFGVAPLPEPSALGGANLAIARHTDQPRAAQALIEFLTSARSEQILFERGGLPATREVVYRDKAVKEKYPYADDVLEGVRTARSRPVTPYYNQFSQEFTDAVHAALQDGTPPRREDLKKRLEEALEGG